MHKISGKSIWHVQTKLCLWTDRHIDSYTLPQTLFYGKNNKFIKKRGACCLIQQLNNIWATPGNNNNHASCGGLGACRLIQQQNNIWATPDNTWQQPCIMWPKKNSTVTTVVTHREKCSARTWGDRHGSQIQKAGSLWKR